ncbi:response regulator [Clostridium tyrobutyricum]|jgi:DNA-binding response OmpR family regulator|uniref:Stage 0 sporulation protein A homolog n=1 Tax=Clostridium tyrobutyricum DIVETGP TaxID=1408889 RepID=W6NLS8_CLOTY|nr:response regulator transcription factor [Clostridium tyrobutyricum]AND84658.1 response regulator [Clostridium tyrobutyricum]ANP69258.1 DNA-binding response regulator [Clostridium tyrobutyricum]MBV4432380.1 response regulator transcription factor [Clostridium tyrobutyricum]MBV4433345.1 response regulator transcription factor [Clostridium tyrobutyricum]MBV4448202.1 response regulator transcription factor [Clostridium tyrobutyricum]
MKDIYDGKLLIVDDEVELLDMIKEILFKAGFSRIYTALSCSDAEKQFYKVNPDCIILDVMLPDGDGFGLFKKFREKSQIPVLFLSARDEDENRLLGLGLGADDYIPKPFLPRELILRLSAVLRRTYFPIVLNSIKKPIFYLGERKIDFNSGTVVYNNKQVSLTAKEYVLLEKLYENRGNIVTGDSLCRTAWNDRLYGYENTLMVHIRRLREKIEKDPSNPVHIITARGLGYKLSKEK